MTECAYSFNTSTEQFAQNKANKKVREKQQNKYVDIKLNEGAIDLLKDVFVYLFL